MFELLIVTVKYFCTTLNVIVVLLRTTVVGRGDGGWEVICYRASLFVYKKK